MPGRIASKRLLVDGRKVWPKASTYFSYSRISCGWRVSGGGSASYLDAHRRVLHERKQAIRVDGKVHGQVVTLLD